MGNKIPAARLHSGRVPEAMQFKAELVGPTGFPVRVMLLGRVVPLALVLGCGLRGAEESLPPIFAPKPAASAPPPLLVARLRLNSDGMSELLTQRLREKAAALEIPKPLAPDTPGTMPVILEKIVVLGEKEKGDETAEKISATERFLKTGRFFETTRTHGDLKFAPTRAGDVRVEVGVTYRW